MGNEHQRGNSAAEDRDERRCDQLAHGEAVST
jgi:hypothetical protein